MEAKPFWQERVVVPGRLEWAWEAFWTLSTSRDVGRSGPRYLSFDMIDRYAARYGITGLDDFEEFSALIRAMDAVFIEHANRS